MDEGRRKFGRNFPWSRLRLHLHPPAPERIRSGPTCDLLLFAAMTLPCMALGILLVRGVVWLFHRHPALVVVELLPAQILGYLMVFGAIAVMFRAQYGKPFWRSLALGCLRMCLSPGSPSPESRRRSGWLLPRPCSGRPETSNPMTELMQDRTSLFLLALFGITIGPLSRKSWPFAVFCSRCWCAAWAPFSELWVRPFRSACCTTRNTEIPGGTPY